jgi:Sulfotransferase family
MRRATIFVLSDVRSGSTLLDQCLGAHSDVVSLGEVHWLRAYALQDRNIYDPVHPLVCSCGATVPECDFWRSVAAEVGRPLDSLQVALRFRPVALRALHGFPAKLEELAKRGVRQVPQSFRSSLVQRVFLAQRVARDSIDVFDAVCRATHKHYCVDSSKSPFRFRAVYEADPGRTLAVVLGRDYRAVVHSKMKRGEKLERAASSWRNRMRHIEALTRDLPAEQRFQLKYESLCEDPERELRRLAVFLGIDFEPAMLERQTASMHHIGGSPSKFDPARVRISTDHSAEGHFQPEDLQRMRDLVGDVAERWGY